MRSWKTYGEQLETGWHTAEKILMAIHILFSYANDILLCYIITRAVDASVPTRR
jgi:hypothetical protein